MHKNDLNKNLIKTYIFIWILFIIVLSIISFLSWSYLTGYLVGSILSVISYWFNEYVFGILLSKRNDFKFAFVIGFLKFVIWASCFVGITFLLLFINKMFNNKGDGNFMYWCDGVFNIFLFIVGSSMGLITIFAYHIAEPIMKRKKKDKEK